MGGDCKSPGSAFEGSNPSPATTVLEVLLFLKVNRVSVFTKKRLQINLVALLISIFP